MSVVSVNMSDLDRFAFPSTGSVKRDRRTWAFDSSNLPASQVAKYAAQEVSTDYYYTNGSKVTLKSDRYYHC